jgi:hypothetical protein
MKAVEMNDPSIPKMVRRKMKLVMDLWKKHDLTRLRQVRDSSTNLKINIYHNSIGTDSYYHDTEKRYYRWDEVMKLADVSLKQGEKLMSVVLPYKPGVMFVSNSAKAVNLN